MAGEFFESPVPYVTDPREWDDFSITQYGTRHWMKQRLPWRKN